MKAHNIKFDDHMWEDITNRAWELRISIGEYIRKLVQDDMVNTVGTVNTVVTKKPKTRSKNKNQKDDHS